MNEGKVITFIVGASLFIILLIVAHLTGVEKEKNRQFEGVIQEVTYGDKHTPIVKIKGTTFAVGFPNEDFKNKIGIGDSLSKKKNSKVYRLVKHQTGQVILSE